MTNRRQFMASLPVAAAAGATAGFYTTPGNSQERAAAAASEARARLREAAAGVNPNDTPILCNPIDSVRRQIIWDIRACFRLEALAHP